MARPGPGQRVAAAGALAVLAVSLGAAAHILWAQWRPLAASLVLGFVAITFLWQALTTRGPVRLANGVVATLCAAGVIAAGSDIAGEWQELLILGAAAVVSGAFARAALAVRPRQEPRFPRPVHPALFVNPRSGCGQATRLDLAGRALRAGATVVMIEPGCNLRDLAEHAADGGADLLGVAGGDGSLGEVAGVAADRDLPFLVVPIGTRNHFARDAGLDHRHPATALRALDDGTEIRVDLGQAGERNFLNNISFGLYADAVSQPGYRDAKTATLLDRVPDFAGPAAVASGLRCTSPALASVIDPAIVVVSNNPYLPGGLSTPRTRASLTRGQLGVLTLHARSGLDLAVLALAGPGPVEGNAAWSTSLVVVDAPSETVTAALDGEPVDIPTPVEITSRAAALRLRVPRRRNTAHRLSALLSSFTVVRLVACLTGRPDPACQQKPDSGSTIHRHDDRPTRERTRTVNSVTDDGTTSAGTTQDESDSTPGGHEAGAAANARETHPGETHVGGLGSRLNWLRAGVLGANDGIVSVAGLVVGVAGATLERSPILIAGVAGLTAGAVSMALGEYISVSSQRDSELAQLATERHELAQDPDAELHELTALYQAKGLSPATARTVAAELTAHDALAAHVDAELNLNPDELTSPTHAAAASALSFLIGAALPLIAILLPPPAWRVPVTVLVVLVALGLTGWISARIGGGNARRAVLRVVIGGAAGLAVTYGIGHLFGAAVG